MKTVVKAFVTTLVLSTLMVSSLAQSNFDRAMEIYSAGKFDEAKTAFEALAAIGDRSSLFNLGVMHYRGEGVEQSSVKAYVLMKIANDGIQDQAFSRLENAVFAKLTDQQKEEAKQVFTTLDPIYNISTIENNIFPKLLDDEDCVPEVKPLKKPVASYPQSEQNKNKMGQVQLEFTISPEGYPRDVIAAKSTSFAFSKSSVKAILKAVYEPPLNEKPVYGYPYLFTYKFNKDSFTVDAIELNKKLSELELAAQNGDFVAQYRYASTLNSFRSFQEHLSNLNLQYREANKWFMKSAKQGLPNAQFQIGRNMLWGRGCEVDIENGTKWINAAAIGGYTPAQINLAQSALTKSDYAPEKSLAAIGWLRNAAQSDDFTSKVLLAWELSTSNIDDLRDPQEALELLKLDSKKDNYFDDLRILETKAAAYADLGKFKKAIKMQSKAKEMAHKLKWEIPLINERLALYQQGKPYRGSYY